jgi:hypothetical protein
VASDNNHRLPCLVLTLAMHVQAQTSGITITIVVV